ncbi:PREDICTED: nucleolar protein 14-like isoform X2 [Priapulus caudatus]|uniref:Nucleolar protein 14-like isoform X2 n=1 Tax=Priapulus caudatus TaxID=37621 RepID=A0ABM1DYL5_PRICU|nr:PREDICTED: nucleolar protein 14-like isoform X2 [Priapulus caudatus]
MAKNKKAKKKFGLSDKVNSSKSARKGKVNPFEVHFNRQKHNVLGKISKSDTGLPGISRQKALKKRKETLLQEYKKFGKSNTIIDKRIGEYDSTMTEEEKMVQRFALERKRTHEKSAIFNLNEEEELTHYGQSLAGIEKFEEQNNSDDGSEDGWLAGKFTAEAHFGGGDLDKNADGTKKQMTKKEMLEEVIAMSKKRKYEQQTEKESAVELTEKLDKQWNDIASLLSTSKKNKLNPSSSAKQPVDEFDRVVRELQFELKGKPTDRIKTPEEVAREEKATLEQLETERISRMKGVTLENTQQNAKGSHQSADDLSDGFVLNREDKFTLRYKDGKLLSLPPPDKEKKASKRVHFQDNSNADSEDEVDDDVDEESDEDEQSTGSDAEEENYSDLESDDNELDLGECDAEITTGCDRAVKERVVPSKELKMGMEIANAELPYTFPAPGSYDEFRKLIDGYSSADQLVIVERICKCHHPSLAEGNKEKLQTLFRILVEHCGHAAIEADPDVSFINQLTPTLCRLAQQSPTETAQFLQQLVVDKQHAFTEATQKKGGRGQFPGLDMVVLLELVAALYSTSDFQHPIVTPALVYMAQMLAQCQVSSTIAVTTGLLLCTVFLDYVSLSKRFVPEVNNFLYGILFMASIKQDQVLRVYPPFKSVGTSADLLVLPKSAINNRTIDTSPLGLWEMASLKDIEEPTLEFKCTAISVTLKLLCKFAVLYKSLPAYLEIFAPVKNVLCKVPWERYTDSVKASHQQLVQELSNCLETRQSLSRSKKRPQPLKLFEPLIEDKDVERKDKVKRLYALLGNQEGDYKALVRNKRKA